MKKNKKLIYLIIAISFIAISAIGATYAYFLASGYSNKTSTVSVAADALDEVSCTAADLSMTVTGANMKQGSSSAYGTVGKTNSSNITCTSTKHTTGATKCTMDIKYTPTNVFTKSSNNTSNKKELTLSGIGTTTSGTTSKPTYYETDLSTLTSATTIIDDLEWIFDGNDTLTYTMTSKFYNYDFNQNDLAGKTYSGTISVENITCTGVSPTYSTVTFNANGGSVSTSSKQVINGYAYGTLPTPTKSGSTFKGWNGKNLYNPDIMTFTNTTHTAGTEELSFNAGVYDRILNMSKWTPKTSTTYTIVAEVVQNTFNAELRLVTDSRFYFQSYDGTTAVGFPVGFTGTKVITGVTKSDFTNVTLGSFWFQSTNTVTGTFIVKLAVYEGTSITQYESYYIKDSSIVAESGNHTLYAVWQ